MNILEKIRAHKVAEVQDRKDLYPAKLLEQSIHFNAPTVSLKHYLLREDKSGIIAEFKRQSPSKGPINSYAKPEEITLEYMQAGASALSVLTDQEFFGGTNKDLLAARKMNYCPILRKDFIIDKYQIIEAKAIGADAILLIAGILSKEELAEFFSFAHSLQLEVLFEIHFEEEINKLPEGAEIVGINNRNLITFEVDIQHGINLLRKLPADVVKVAESGINSPKVVDQLRSEGFDGFLIGEQFMKSSNPGTDCAEFIKQLQPKQKLVRHED